MKFNYIDGKEGDTDKLPDLPAMHIEAVAKCREILKGAGLSFFLFSIDSQGGGSGSVNVPDDAKLKLAMIQNTDDNFAKMFKGTVRVAIWDDEKYDLAPNVIPRVLKNLTK